jgi:short-subunit dehydrogenase
MKKTEFQGNVVFITGASSGIGQQLAFQLAAQGANLFLIARNKEKLADTEELCNKLGGHCISHVADISKIENCKLSVEAAINSYEKIDTLILNAGISMHASFSELQDISIMEKIMRTNYLGNMWCTYYAIPSLIENSGRIVAISSYGGLFPTPYSSGYAASKHALVGFLNALRVELQRTSVTVTIIHPVWVSTGISSRAMGIDGKPIGTITTHEKNAMSVEKCAKRIIQAATRRKREVVFGIKGHIGRILWLLFPKVVDKEGINTLK